ncbi:MAG: hypothetical protein KDA89_19730, partial [Planctomycetaceae bacterium]|nr:hypothetical protein [Planctomycetaceae bacterium]
DRCERVLLTDLTWPPYLLWMLEHFGSSGIDVSLLPLKHAVWKEGRSADDIAEMILTQLQTKNCDGLFLPAITHTGIKLPVATILNELHHQRAHTATVVDASQAFGHIVTNSWSHLADFTFGGMHKWVRAYLPLAVGFTKHDGSSIRTSLPAEFLPNYRNETMNFSPLITTCGALSDICAKDCVGHESIISASQKRLSEEEWDLITPDGTMQSRIRLIRCHLNANPLILRTMLVGRGIAATVFADGTVRLSLGVTRDIVKINDWTKESPKENGVNSILAMGSGQCDDSGSVACVAISDRAAGSG